MLAALSEVDAAYLADVLEPRHAYAGAGGWAELMLDVVRDLPVGVQGEARRRIEDALALLAASAHQTFRYAWSICWRHQAQCRARTSARHFGRQRELAPDKPYPLG